jgi:hypothetical protein
VDRPELRHFTDVIVLSVKGPRRAADYLSGGDYDGDKGLVIWQPELVDPFENAPLHFSEVRLCSKPNENLTIPFDRNLRKSCVRSPQKMKPSGNF